LENITLGRAIPDKDVSETLNFLGLKKYIAIQNRGVEAPVDPEGRRLPRSVIQKILIARMIVHKPRLLLMEDPLQFLDDSDKKRIIDYIMHPDRDWTVVVIADYPYWKEKSTQVIKLKKHALYF
jgi:ABC-type bacteriocin/lantibiotic exporter with double-glycine peptidase domain